MKIYIIAALIFISLFAYIFVMQENKENLNVEDKYSFQVSLNDFTDFKAINSGQYGKVVKARHLLTNKYFAIKITDENPVREIQYLQQLTNHKNIIAYFNSWRETSKDVIDLFPEFSEVYCIQLELCRGKDLQHWIENVPALSKSVDDAKRIFFQFALGVEYMHSKDIIHRDLKPANILLLNPYVPYEKDLNIKIADLATSIRLHKSNANSNKKLTAYVGTPSYMSPEMEKREKHYNKATDIFSMGLIFYQLLASTMGPLDLSLSEEYRIRNGTLPLQFFQKFPREYYLIKRMLWNDPSKRPTASYVFSKIIHYNFYSRLEL